MPAVAGYADRSKQMILPWRSRSVRKVFWRGRTTGSRFDAQNWRLSHRIRLHNITNFSGGEVPVLVEDRATGVLSRKTFSRRELNDAYMDVGLVGPPIQCHGNGTCDKMRDEIGFRPEVAASAGADYKFALDVGKPGLCIRLPMSLTALGGATI